MVTAQHILQDIFPLQRRPRMKKEMIPYIDSNQQ